MKLFDLHCDTIYECCETGKHLRENDLHINYAAAHRYQPYVQFFALFRRQLQQRPRQLNGRTRCLLQLMKTVL